MKLKPTLIAVAVASVFAGSVQAQTTTSKTEGQSLTQFSRTGITLAWGRGFTGQGIRVAILDSGFDLSNIDLKGQVVGAKNFNPIVAANTLNNPNNFRSNIQAGSDITWSLHGTQMASIVAGRLNNDGVVGVAPNAQLLLAQVGQGVIWNNTTKAWTYSDTGISNPAVLSALTWAEANGATVANMSFGSSFDKTFQSGTWNNKFKYLEGSAIKDLVSGTITGISNKDVVIFGNNTKETYQANVVTLNGKTTTTFTLLNNNTIYSKNDGYTVVGNNTTTWAQTGIFKDGVWQNTNGVFVAPTAYGSMYGNTVKDLAAFANASKNLVMVVSAGNDGLPYAQFPGAYATQTDANGNLVLGGRVLIVGSVNANNVISTFSNRAGSFCTNLVGTTCNDKYYVKDFFVVAPGELIPSALPSQLNKGNYNYVSGTSPAAAYVSGGIALMKQAWPQLAGAQLVQLVKETATDLGAKGVDEIYGYGLVNFDKATQPYAGVKYSTAALKSGPAVAGSSIGTTGMTAASPAFKTSSVLQNVQVVDGLNRNYTADFTRAIGTSTPANSLYTSPYLAMQSQGYREFAVPVGQDAVMTVMQTATGFAGQVETSYKQGRISFQVGAMTEQNGFLNNVGSGLFATGGSSTSYAVVGGSYPLAGSVDLVGNYGVGITRTSNVQDSMLAVSPTMISDTWKLGLAKKEIFFSGKTQDQLMLAVHGPVSIRRGHADVTAVTGYTYSGSEDAVVANPTITTERVNLAQGQRQHDLILGYSISIKNHTYAGINIARQFNVGGIAGQTGSAVGVMVRSVF